VNALSGYFPREGIVPGREREIAVLRTAARVGCGYEAAHHRPTAARLGLTQAEIEAALDPGSAHAWGPADRALLRFVDELLDGHTVSGDAWDGLDGSLDEVQRLELLILVGFYAMLGGMLNAVGVELET
jgi:4-carboxymuconolactone decarboxylase